MIVDLLANENVPFPLIAALQRSGIDVSAIASRSPRLSDVAVLTLARRESRWLVTYDRDYGELIFVRGLAAPPAILYLRQELSALEATASVLRELVSRPEEVVGYFLVIGDRSIRRRVLPATQG